MDNILKKVKYYFALLSRNQMNLSRFQLWRQMSYVECWARVQRTWQIHPKLGPSRKGRTLFTLSTEGAMTVTQWPQTREWSPLAAPGLATNSIIYVCFFLKKNLWLAWRANQWHLVGACFLLFLPRLSVTPLNDFFELTQSSSRTVKLTSPHAFLLPEFQKN